MIKCNMCNDEGAITVYLEQDPWGPGFASLCSCTEELINTLKAELAEEGRINAMSGSRELKLITERERLKADLEVACETLNDVKCDVVRASNKGGVFWREYCRAKIDATLERMGRS